MRKTVLAIALLVLGSALPTQAQEPPGGRKGTGLPVEITAEFETWRRIRDSLGTEGWVLHSLLSGRRTALVTPWAKGEAQPLPLYERADERAEVVARLQPGVIANVRQCTGSWCRIVVVAPKARDLVGFVRQDRLWGVYPNEKVE